MDHGHEQIDKEQEGDDADADCFHCVLLKLLAEADVKTARDEKQNDDCRENEVAHNATNLNLTATEAVIK